VTLRRQLGTACRCPVFMKSKWIIFTFFCTFFLFSLVPFHVLQIKAFREGNIVFIRIVHPDERFATRYIHSVEHCPVREYFRIDDDFRIILYETTFSSSNTGLPYATFGNEEFHNDVNHFRISNMCRILPKLLLWVNEKYDNTLKINDFQELKLPLLAGNTLLQIKIRKVTFLEFVYLKAKILLEG